MEQNYVCTYMGQGQRGRYWMRRINSRIKKVKNVYGESEVRV